MLRVSSQLDHSYQKPQAMLCPQGHNHSDLTAWQTKQLYPEGANIISWLYVFSQYYI